MTKPRVGGGVSESTLQGTFETNNTALLDPRQENRFVPNAAVMFAQLETNFGNLSSEYANGKIEISTLKYSNFFAITELRAAAEYAARLNAQPDTNVYVCASLLHPDVESRVAARRSTRARKEDFLSAPCAWIDIDSFDGDEAALAARYAAAPPTWRTITGRKPTLRTHLFWRFREPCTSTAIIEKMNAGLVEHFNGDHAATDATRLMRLAGSIAWPTKAGRKIELTEGTLL